MKTDKDFELALRVATWLGNNGCTTSILEKEDAFYVHYTLKLDMKPQPPVRVCDSGVNFPAGSQQDVIFAFLGC